MEVPKLKPENEIKNIFEVSEDKDVEEEKQISENRTSESSDSNFEEHV